MSADGGSGGARVFVYGTLKRGGCNHHLLTGQRFITGARTLPVYRLYDLGGYPGMVIADPGVSIAGEIWQVSAPCLAALDELESVDEGEYTRERVLLAAPDNDPAVEGYLYARPVAGRAEVTGGVW